MLLHRTITTPLLGESFWTAPIVLIVIGSVIFVVACFGCCGAAKESPCMIITFSVFLGLVFLAEIGIGVAGYYKHEELSGAGEGLQRNAGQLLQQSLPAQEAWNLDPVGDEVLRLVLPRAADRDEQVHPEARRPGGLLPRKLSAFLGSKSLILAGIGVGLAAVQLVAVLLACCLYGSFRRQIRDRLN
ncbi:hypothetical protein quinque_010885 [Culex quinquefasciatus]